ncbi:hypothetical protein [Arthrobacter sp. M4]|uniref:hypothetical protein n=1 Tax=Arthrobacter sp. M4 TaxID=218160 RepID=UPI001CDD01F6|nr:hypothetical protein [Arthrobacter sp. M4]MCA4134588.1 hypothetical protein [Arthrobacter sp. M4]
MSLAVLVLLVLLAALALVAMLGTVLVVIHDGRGHLPPEESEYAWTPGQLPNRPYSSPSIRP